MTTATRLKQLRDNGIIVRLTPDDILTLKLLRDDFNRATFQHPEDPRRLLKYIPEGSKILETLERILKQV